MNVDVAVIGAGIVGCAAARRLAREGVSVAVIDADEPGHQASWAAAGMLAPQAEAHGPNALLPLLLLAGRSYAELIPQLQDETRLDLGYSTEGMLLVAFDEVEAEALSHRYEWQTSEGLAVERLTSAEAVELEPMLAPTIRTALRFPDDRRVDNRKLVRALWFSASQLGARFLASRAVRIVRPDAVGVTIELEDGEKVAAGRVVLAAGSWSGTIGGLPRPLPVEPVHGQLMSVRTQPPLLRHAVGSSRGYVVPRSDGQVILGTTAERIGFRKSVTPAGLLKISAAAIEIAPSLGDAPIVAHWSGLRPGTPDGLPILGPDPAFPALLYATGHFRNGILLGPLTGAIVAELAMGMESRIDLTPYRPDRFTPS